MILFDFKCDDCNTIFEIKKNSTFEDFPDKILCPKCGSSNTWRKWGLGTFEISQGAFGNAKNSYENSMGAYHYAEITGKVKGTKIKTIKG
jgi:putative FmdB family regulatory protein